MGGDTDTNACIVGGIIGAYVGFCNLNEEHLKKLFTYDCVTKGQTRPEFLSVGRYAI